MSQVEITETSTVCYNHPNRETMLRCNRCEQPICTECAVLTPTGYRCKQCVRGQQKIFDTAIWIDYPLAMLVGAALSFLGSYIAQWLGWFVIFFTPVIGVFIAEAIRWTVRRRRSPLLYRLATASVVLGALPILLFDLFYALSTGLGSYGWLNLLWPAVYTFLATSTVYYRLSGIRLKT